MKRDDPDLEPVPAADGLPWPAPTILTALSPLVLPRRLARMERVIAQRTRRLTVVLDGISDPHNMSAVLRSADAFGVQDVHVIESDQPFQAARTVAKGAHRWLDVRKHPAPADCAAQLRTRGYRLFVASMEGRVTPRELSRLLGDHPIAIAFGNEHRGPSAAMREAADGTFAIPMRGFVESLNVSVAAAVTLHALRAEWPGDLNPSEREELLARFLLRTVRDAERIVKESLAG